MSANEPCKDKSIILERLDTDIWCHTGGTVTSFGFSYPTRMIVIRLRDESLLVWSPTEPNRDIFETVNAMGKVRYIIAPNDLHHLFLLPWIERFPDAHIYGPRCLSRKRTDVTFEGFLDYGPVPWIEDLDQIVVHGNRITTEIVFFHKSSQTVLFTDILQNLPADLNVGWRKLIAKLDLMTSPTPQVPRKFRLAWTDRTSARRFVDELSEWPAERLIMAHGPIITRNVKDLLQAAFQWLD